MEKSVTERGFTGFSDKTVTRQRKPIAAPPEGETIRIPRVQRMDSTLRALNRFGLGARRGERQKIGDGRQWLRAQLDGGPPSLAPPDGVTATAIGDALRAIRMGGQGNDQERRQARRHVVEMSQAEMHAALTDTHHHRAAVRRASRRVLVQPSVRLDRLEDHRRAAGRQLRARGDPAARARTLRGHGPRLGEASRDARLSRQLSIHRTDLPRRRRGSTRTTVNAAD